MKDDNRTQSLSLRTKTTRLSLLNRGWRSRSLRRRRLRSPPVDTERIRSVCDGLLRDYRDHDEAIANFTKLVRENLDRPPSNQYHTNTAAPHPIVRPDLIYDNGNLRAVDIGITWQGSDTFLHGVRVVGPNAAEPPLRPRPATSTPYIPAWEHVSCHMSTPPPTGTTVMLGGHIWTNTPEHTRESSGLLTGHPDSALQQ